MTWMTPKDIALNAGGVKNEPLLQTCYLLVTIQGALAPRLAREISCAVTRVGTAIHENHPGNLVAVREVERPAGKKPVVSESAAERKQSP